MFLQPAKSAHLNGVLRLKGDEIDQKVIQKLVYMVSFLSRSGTIQVSLMHISTGMHTHKRCCLSINQ